jgi:hypothetical protein
VTSYNVYYSTHSGVTKTSGIKAAANPAYPESHNQISYTVQRLTDNVPYFFVLTSVNANGESAESAEQSATPSGAAAAVTSVRTGTFENLQAFSVYPNPWRVDLNASDPVTFANLPAGSTIKIFTVSGHFVKTLANTIPNTTWDLTNDAGQNVASGIYIYLINGTPDGKNHTGQVSIIR